MQPKGADTSASSLGKSITDLCKQRCERGENSHILPVSEETRSSERGDRHMTVSEDGPKVRNTD